jgi:hypothetical protein
MARLEAELKSAVEAMATNSRKGAALAVRGVLEFVHAHPHLTSQGLSQPFFALLAALEDLDHGRVAPMLQAKVFGNRPPDSSILQMAKGHACFYVDQLKAVGESLESACSIVAAKWTFNGFPLQKKRDDTPNWKVIKGWRDGISKLPTDNAQRIVLEALRGEAKRRNGLNDMSKSALLSGLDKTLKQLRQQ